MSQKTVNAYVYGKEYTLACDAGQEQHLLQLVHQINSRTEQLDKAVGKLPEPLMLLYTALMLADELHDTTRNAAHTKDELARTQRQIAEGGDDARLAALEEDMAESLHELAGRIEVLAEKLAS
jgi:cell division protein ZapA